MWAELGEGVMGKEAWPKASRMVHFAVAGTLSAETVVINSSVARMNYRAAGPSSLLKKMYTFCSTVLGAVNNFSLLCSFRPLVRGKYLA